MTEQLILRELHLLLEAMKVEVLHFVQFLKQNQTAETSFKRKRQAGMLKGKIWMSPDFDAPLEDFKDYM